MDCTGTPYATCTKETLRLLLSKCSLCGCEACRMRQRIEERHCLRLGYEIKDGSHIGVPKDRWWKLDGYTPIAGIRLVVINELRVWRSSVFAASFLDPSIGSPEWFAEYMLNHNPEKMAAIRKRIQRGLRGYYAAT